MRNNLTKTASILFTLLLSLDIFAGDVITKIRFLAAVNNQYANLEVFTHDDVAGHPCAANGRMFSFDKTTEHGKFLYTTLLTAAAADKNVRLYYSDTTCGLWGNQALIYRVNFHNY